MANRHEDSSAKKHGQWSSKNRKRDSSCTYTGHSRSHYWECKKVPINGEHLWLLMPGTFAHFRLVCICMNTYMYVLPDCDNIMNYEMCLFPYQSTETWTSLSNPEHETLCLSISTAFPLSGLSCGFIITHGLLTRTLWTQDPCKHNPNSFWSCVYLKLRKSFQTFLKVAFFHTL